MLKAYESRVFNRMGACVQIWPIRQKEGRPEKSLLQWMSKIEIKRQPTVNAALRHTGTSYEKKTFISSIVHRGLWLPTLAQHLTSAGDKSMPAGMWQSFVGNFFLRELARFLSQTQMLDLICIQTHTSTITQFERARAHDQPILSEALLSCPCTRDVLIQ